jgi:hypothetical protein
MADIPSAAIAILRLREWSLKRIVPRFVPLRDVRYRLLAHIWASGSTRPMLDAIRPWLHLIWRIVVLLPLVNKRPSKWLGRPIRRSNEPARFWIMCCFGVFLVAIGGFETLERAVR